MVESGYKEIIRNSFTVLPEKNTQVFLGDIEFGCLRYNIGKPKMRELAEQAGAIVYVGKLWRFIVPKMDEYFLGMCENS